MGVSAGPIAAVIINHNTSVYAEIALRSLRYADAENTLGSITIVDNHSTDDTGTLRAAASALGAQFELSRWPAAEVQNTHGDVLRDFVLSRPEAGAFLFVESDICFLEPGTVSTMALELCRPDTWAVQARLLSNTIPTADELFVQAVKYQRPSRPIGLRSQLLGPGANGQDRLIRETTHWATIIPRCHPACALLRNDEVLQLIAKYLGFTHGWNWSLDRSIAGFSDTLAVASQAMRTHGRRFVYSERSVLHFWHGTASDASSDSRCMRVLEELRSGTGRALMPIVFPS